MPPMITGPVDVVQGLPILLSLGMGVFRLMGIILGYYYVDGKILQPVARSLRLGELIAPDGLATSTQCIRLAQHCSVAMSLFQGTAEQNMLDPTPQYPRLTTMWPFSSGNARNGCRQLPTDLEPGGRSPIYGCM
jgi:hypothetical protein